MILGILQARVSSTRLPGKVLAPILGDPMIVRQLERLSQSRTIDKLVVATSTDSSDDVLARELAQRGALVRRGPLDDVVSRFEQIIEEFDPAHIVRLTADCPLCDIEVIDKVIRSHVSTGSDYTSNTLDPTYPDGLDVEVVSATAWRQLVGLELSAREREHVTLGLYSRPSEFALHSVTQEENHADLRWTVDVAADLDFVRTVFDHLHTPGRTFGQADVLRLIKAHPELNRTSHDLARNSGLAPE